MIDRIEELLGRMAAESEDGGEPDALALPGERAVRPAPPEDGDAGGEIRARDGTGAADAAPEGPGVPEEGETEADLSGLDEFDLPAPLLPAPERVENGAGDGPAAPAGVPAEASGGPGAPEPSQAGLEELYRQTVRETLPPPALPAPQGGQGTSARRAEEPGSAASLAVDELDRAVRRDSRRYDGEMQIY